MNMNRRFAFAAIIVLFALSLTHANLREGQKPTSSDPKGGTNVSRTENRYLSRR